MKRLLALAISIAPALGAQEVDNVAAFARLYGVARYFYPSDAAAALDWNHFAVHGVSRVRAARNPAELEKTLEELFTPLGPGIEIGRTLSAKSAAGARDASLVAWRYRGAGMSATIRGPYSGKRVNRAAPVVSDPNAFANISQMIQADTLRGKTLRLRGRMRVANPNAKGWAAFWLRVDRAQGIGFFDNMQDRPVRDTMWREYVIEGPIAPDAVRVFFGALSSGDVVPDIDAIQLDIRAEGGTWTPLAVADATFDADSAASRWIQNGARAEYSISRSNGVVRVTRINPKDRPPERPADDFETPIDGASVDFELARGLKARVPLSLTDADARRGSADMPALKLLQDPWRRDDADVRLADVIVAWNVFRHFYPYLQDLALDWDARLRPQLETALKAASTREAHLETVRALVADARDGHGSVRDVANPLRTGMLPLRFRILEGKAVVTASSVPAISIGSVVTQIDSASAADRIAKEMRLASGTMQWRQSRAAGALPMCRLGSDVKLKLESGEVTVPCNMLTPAPAEPRPDTIAELEPGIWYVDITRARMAQITPLLSKLASARGMVVDLRGYPTDAGAQLLPYLVSTPENDKWMHVSRIAGPFGDIVDWQSMSWNLQPASPHISARRVFLTHGGAISYAESVMGYVRDHKLATIIGGTTAGTNGNIADFTVPGGFSIIFTGMRVTRHDGTSPYHMLGVAPDIPLEPTIAGIRAGKDDVLERALTVLRSPQP